MRVVGGIGIPHTPHFPVMVDQGAPLGAELERLYGELARRFEELAPDVVIFFTTDHYNVFFVESIPIFSIGVAESTRGPRDYTNLKQYEVPIDAGLARSIQTHLVRGGFDVGQSQEFEVDHPVTIPLHFLRPQMDVPIVPVYVSAFIRPIPTAQRVRALGAAIRDAVEQAPGDGRVLALGTGSFSLEIGGPRISAESHTGVPDPAWADRIMELLQAGDLDALVAEATDEQMANAGNAGGEILDWIAMLAMLDPGPPDFLEAQRQFGHAYGAWSQNGAGR
jgi:aromatic ring-opening dioxygenase catalytic subunit (LigB family)